MIEQRQQHRQKHIHIVSIDRPMCLYIVCVYKYISWCARDAAISVIYLCINPCRYK